MRWIFATLALFAMLGLGAGLAAQELEKQREALKTARAEAEAAERRSAALTRRAEDANSEADRTAAEVQAVAERIKEAEAEVKAARARIAIIRELQRQQTYKLAEQQEPLVRLTAALQKLSRRPTVIALFEPRSMAEIIHVRAAMKHVLPEVRRRTKALREEVERSRQLRAQMSQALDSLQDGRRELVARRGDLAALEREQRGTAQQLIADAGLESDRALALGERARDILDRMDVIRDSQTTRERLAGLDGPVLRPEQRDTAPIVPRRRFADAYRLPVAGTLQVGLGEETGSGYRARGLTLQTEPNARVVAPAGGRVTYAGRYRGFGSIVIIRHDDNWTTLVANMVDLRVVKGARVAQGALIGVAGTGEDSGIIVELRRKDRPVDIAALIG